MVLCMKTAIMIPQMAEFYKGVSRLEGKLRHLKIDTQRGIFELDGLPIMEQTVSCTIYYRGQASSVVELTILADVDLEGYLEVQTKNIKGQRQK